MQEFRTIQIDCLRYLGSYSMGHAGQGCVDDKTKFLPRHFHGNQYELTCILDGEGVAYCNDTPHEVHAGDVFVSFPYEYHRLEVKPGTVLYQRFVTFSVNAGNYFERLNHVWLDNIAPDKRTFRDAFVPLLIEEIAGELQKDDLYAAEVLENLLEAVILRMLRGMADKKPQSLSANPTAQDLCRHVQHYVNTHLFTLHSLTEVAEAVSYNYSYLSACFKKTTGQTITAYYTQKRLEAAKALIYEQQLSLTEIARKLGYSGIYSFSKAFRDFYGISPSDYRDRKLREKERLYTLDRS